LFGKFRLYQAAYRGRAYAYITHMHLGHAYVSRMHLGHAYISHMHLRHAYISRMYSCYEYLHGWNYAVVTYFADNAMHQQEYREYSLHGV